MVNRSAAALLAAFLAMQSLPGPAMAENQMGYQLLSMDQASQLPHNGGVLGMNVGRAQLITDQGLSFELLKVNGVGPNSPGAQAGFRAGDQIIAVNGRVFPSVAAFAGYIGSVQPGSQISVDYIPAGGGPQQAQRVGVTVGGKGAALPAPTATPAPAQPSADQPQAAGLSTGAKIAIGVGAAALFGCYKVGCISRLKARFGNGGQQRLPAAQQ